MSLVLRTGFLLRFVCHFCALQQNHALTICFSIVGRNLEAKHGNFVLNSANVGTGSGTGGESTASRILLAAVQIVLVISEAKGRSGGSKVLSYSSLHAQRVHSASGDNTHLGSSLRVATPLGTGIYKSLIKQEHEALHSSNEGHGNFIGIFPKRKARPNRGLAEGGALTSQGVRPHDQGLQLELPLLSANSQSVPAGSRESSTDSGPSVNKSQLGRAGNGTLNLQLKSIQEDGPAHRGDGRDDEYALKAAAKRRAIKMMISNAQGLDLCFLMDATLSMGNCIELVKHRVADIADAIKATYPACNLRVSCVVYRDYDDKKNNKKAKCDFTSDFQGVGSTFKKYLSSVRLKHGDDYAEDVFTGLERVAQLDWQATNRLLVHIGDAPCHGSQFHNLPEGSDNYLSGDKFGRNIVDLLQKLYGDCRISKYFFCHIGEHAKKMIEEFKKAISAEDWIKEDTFENVDNIPQEVISIARSTISTTMRRSTFRTSRSAENLCTLDLETKVVVPSEPDWETITVLRGRRFKHKSYDSVDELLTRAKSRQSLEIEKINTVDIKVAPSPFSAEGAARWPFYATILDPDGNKKMVVKRFKISRGRSLETFHAEERYMQQMEVQTVADHLAREFNDRTKDFQIQNLNKVEFILVSTLSAGFKFFNMEKYLTGEWIRYSNNAGYVNTSEYAPTLQAFTHWTQERSGGLLMVTDLQGVLKPRGSESDGKYDFFLSDPAIHCSDVLRFNDTNLGEQGFELFFLSHECNDICRKLGLKSTR